MVIEDESVDVDDIAARLSRFGENSVLNYFWLMMREGAKPITVLKWMSKVVIERPDWWDKAAIRLEHEHGTSKLGATVGNKSSCYACGNSDCYLYFHHIIEVQNGGGNHIRNLVQICFSCHKVLHPWLTVEPKPRRGGGFQDLNTIAKNMVGRMRQRK